MLRILCTIDRGTIVLAVSGRLEAANVSELRESLDAMPAGVDVALDLMDLVLADRDAVRLLKHYEARVGVVLRNCPAYIRSWMAAEGTP